MGKLNENEKEQISRVEKTLRMKLTKQQIIGILGRNPYEKQKVGRPITKTKVKRIQTIDYEKRKQRQQRKEAFENDKKSLHLKKLFAEKIPRKKKVESEVDIEIKHLFESDQEWEIDFVGEEISINYPSATWKHYKIRFAENQKSPMVIKKAILDMIRLSITKDVEQSSLGSKIPGVEISHSNKI